MKNALIDVTLQILCGGLLGMIGQGMRVVAGLKKSSDSAAAAGMTLAEVFDGRTLLISLLIGFVAGALAMLTAAWPGPLELTRSLLATIVAAGYAGSDFIEAFFKTTGASARPAIAAPDAPMG
jgi:hypothetical protein